mgnify:CR=1 FL=1
MRPAPLKSALRLQIRRCFTRLEPCLLSFTPCFSRGRGSQATEHMSSGQLTPNSPARQRQPPFPSQLPILALRWAADEPAGSSVVISVRPQAALAGRCRPARQRMFRWWAIVEPPRRNARRQWPVALTSTCSKDRNSEATVRRWAVPPGPEALWAARQIDAFQGDKRDPHRGEVLAMTILTDPDRRAKIVAFPSRARGRRIPGRDHRISHASR